MYKFLKYIFCKIFQKPLLPFLRCRYLIENSFSMNFWNVPSWRFGLLKVTCIHFKSLFTYSLISFEAQQFFYISCITPWMFFYNKRVLILNHPTSCTLCDVFTCSSHKLVTKKIDDFDDIRSHTLVRNVKLLFFFSLRLQ